MQQINNVESRLIRDRRWVYGTKTDRWYFVDETDRDWDSGITREEMKELGPDAAKEKYLNPKIIK